LLVVVVVTLVLVTELLQVVEVQGVIELLVMDQVPYKD
jgi:hypothetical protein